MSDEHSNDVAAYSEHERTIADGFVREAYGTLLTQARHRRRRAGFQDTMMTDDVLQETFMKLTGQHAWQSQEHFLRSAMLAVRQVIVDHARSRLTAKRGTGQRALPLEEAAGLLPEFNETPEQLVIMDDLLALMELEKPRWVRIVDARYFSGMTEAETAAILGVSERTIRREWHAARSWLEEKMLG